MEEREKHMTNYEDGITFLEQQLTRAQHKLEEKTRALQAAHEEVATIRAEAAQEASDNLEKIMALKEE
jgi:vacuolar-type H+-ATPase subunit E/Vma4